MHFFFYIVQRDRSVVISRHGSVRILFVGLDEEQSLKEKMKVDRRGELLSRAFGAAARIKKHEN